MNSRTLDSTLATAAAPVPPKPRSEAQREASRRNGAKSRGPISAGGKARSSKNALKHGLYSDSLYVLNNEQQGSFLATLELYLDEYQPQSHTESEFARQLAWAEFNLHRFATMEVTLINVTQDLLASSFTERAIPEPARTAFAFESLHNKSRALELIQRNAARHKRE